MGLLQRAHITAGEFRYVGKETDRKWEEGDDISVREFKIAEFGRTKTVFATEEVKNDIKKIGIKKCARKWFHTILRAEIASRKNCKAQVL
jgi:hypothetical protein